MYCRICGSEEDARYYEHARRTLCRYCAEDTPKKVDRETFEKTYWGEQLPEVDRNTRQNFWEDYLSSRDTLKKYIEHTTSYC